MKINRSLLPLLMSFVLLACRENKKETSTTENKILPDTIISASQKIPVNIYPGIDLSPMDMSYFPIDYPKLKMTDSATPLPVTRVIYSRPHLQKRRLFRDLLKYGEPWRLGANEATEIDFYKAVTIQGKKIEPGRYILYSIPHIDNWTIVLNANIDSWGLHQDTSKDLQRFKIPVTVTNSSQEYFTMVFEKTNDGADLVITWDDLLAKLPVKFQ